MMNGSIWPEVVRSRRTASAELLTGDNGDGKPREKKGRRWLDGVRKRTTNSVASDFIEGKEERGRHGRPNFNADASSIRLETATDARFTKLKKGKGGGGARARGGGGSGRGDERGRPQLKPAAVLKQGGGWTEVGEGESSARLGAAGWLKGPTWQRERKGRGGSGGRSAQLGAAPTGRREQGQ